MDYYTQYDDYSYDTSYYDDDEDEYYYEEEEDYYEEEEYYEDDYDEEEPEYDYEMDRICTFLSNIYQMPESMFTQSHYDCLNTKFELLDDETDEYQNIVDYVDNTHGETHSFQVDVVDIFSIKRKEENYLRYNYIPRHGNKQMLWHGTELKNYISILQNGLQPWNSYGNNRNMFGNGVYFADCVTKAAQYCKATPYSPTGILILAEVALGNIYYKTSAEFIYKLPPGKNSCKGAGVFQPSQVTPTPRSKHGIFMPLGPLQRRNYFESDLIYNEYVVYEESRIILQYLVEVEFSFY